MRRIAFDRGWIAGLSVFAAAQSFAASAPATGYEGVHGQHARLRDAWLEREVPLQGPAMIKGFHIRMAKTATEFWAIESIDFTPKRWTVEADDLEWFHATSWRSDEGRALDEGEWPAPAAQFHYEKLPRVEDLVDSRMFIVSPRLREFLETEAPGHCQFLPVHIRGPKPEDPQFDYWAINWLHAIDCLHPQAYDGTFTSDGRPNVMVPIIDASRIPSDILIGPIKDFRVQIIIREDLMRKMKARKFIKPWFQRMAHADGRNFTPFMRTD